MVIPNAVAYGVLASVGLLILLAFVVISCGSNVRRSVSRRTGHRCRSAGQRLRLGLLPRRRSSPLGSARSGGAHTAPSPAQSCAGPPRARGGTRRPVCSSSPGLPHGDFRRSSCWEGSHTAGGRKRPRTSDLSAKWRGGYLPTHPPVCPSIRHLSFRYLQHGIPSLLGRGGPGREVYPRM